MEMYIVPVHSMVWAWRGMISLAEFESHELAVACSAYTASLLAGLGSQMWEPSQ